MYGLDVMYSFRFRLIDRDKLDLYVGAGFNTMAVVSYRNKWEKIESGTISETKEWGSASQYEEALFGANCGITFTYLLNDHLTLNAGLNTRGNMEFALTSATRYTAQNLRLVLVYLFNEREKKKTTTIYE